MKKFEVDENVVEVAFDLLGKALASQKLPTRRGIYRQAQASEFMYMGTANGFYQMKHRDTRNYVFVSVDSGQMWVPQEKSRPFFRGEFDYYEV
jgi:hypothetical protein